MIDDVTEGGILFKDHFMYIRRGGGRVVIGESDEELSLVPGASINLKIWASEFEAIEITTEILSCEERARRRYYTIKIQHDLLPLWLSQLLNIRSSFRVEPAEKQPIDVIIKTTHHQWEGQIINTAVDGCALWCNGTMKIMALDEPSCLIDIQFPTGECHFKATIKNLKQHDKGCRVGLVLHDDGSRIYRQYMQILRGYVMDRQRWMAKQRVTMQRSGVYGANDEEDEFDKKKDAMRLRIPEFVPPMDSL